MSAIYKRPGGIFSFPFTVRDQYGRLANWTTPGTLVLTSDDANETTPSEAVSFRSLATGVYVGDVDADNAALLAAVSADCFDEDKIIGAYITGIVADSVEDLGDILSYRTYVIGHHPSTPGEIDAAISATHGDGSYETGPSTPGAVTGAYDVQVTVTNQATSDAISGATVTFRSGLNYQARTTNSSGVVTQALPVGVWRVIVWYNGYSISETTVTIEEEDDPLVTIEVDVELVSNAVLPPDSPEKLTGWFVAQDNEGNPAEGIDFEIRIVRTNTGSGVAADTEFIRATSAANGLVQWASIVPLYTYHVRAANRRLPGGTFSAPALDDETVVDGAFEIPEFTYLTD